MLEEQARGETDARGTGARRMLEADARGGGARHRREAAGSLYASMPPVVPLRSLRSSVARVALFASACRGASVVVRPSLLVRRCSLARRPPPFVRSFVVARSSARASGGVPLPRHPLSPPPLSLALSCVGARLRAVLSRCLLSLSLSTCRRLASRPPATASHRRRCLAAAVSRLCLEQKPRAKCPPPVPVAVRLPPMPCGRAADSGTSSGTSNGTPNGTGNDTRERPRAKGLRHCSDTGNDTGRDTGNGTNCGTPFYINININIFLCAPVCMRVRVEPCGFCPLRVRPRAASRRLSATIF